MKRLIRISLIIATINSIAVSHADDMMKAAPNNTKVLFENDRVRVLETRLLPGKSLPMHSHPPRVNYFLNPTKERITYTGELPKEFNWKAGEVAYFPEVSLEVTNIGSNEIHNIVVELKTPSNALHSPHIAR